MGVFKKRKYLRKWLTQIFAKILSKVLKSNEWSYFEEIMMIYFRASCPGCDFELCW
jgi:hypothetical protein